MCKKQKQKNKTEETSKKTLIIAISKKTDNQTENLSKIIQTQQPNNITFLITEDCKEVQRDIIKNYTQITNEKLPSKNTISINKNETLPIVCEKLEKRLNTGNEIIFDHTYATGTLDTGLYLIKDKNPNVDLIKIDEKTQKIINENLDFLDYRNLIKNVKFYFNNKNFDMAVKELSNFNKSSLSPDKSINLEAHLMLSMTYKLFDDGQYKTAYEGILKLQDLFYHEFPQHKTKLLENRKALKILSDKHDENYKKYYLADMINDANRRILEVRYNDAISRLYRALGVISEIELGEMGIDPTNLDIYYLKTKLDKKVYKEKFQYKISHDEVNNVYFTCGLTCNMELIYELRKYAELGQFYKQNMKKFIKIVNYRHRNKYAHGYNDANRKECEEFMEFVLDFAKITIPEIQDILNKTEFLEL